MRIVNQKDMLTGVFYSGFGALTAAGASHYEIGSASAMGPGFFPLLAGVVLLVIGLLIIATAVSVRSEAGPLGRWAFSKIIIVLVAVLAFAATLEPLGLIIALPLLVGISSYAHPAASWRGTLALTAFMLVLVPVIFVYLLGLSIPLLPSISV